MRSLQQRFTKECALEVGPVKGRLVRGDAIEMSLGQQAFAQVRPLKIGIVENGLRQVCPFQMGLNQVGAPQIRALQGLPFEIRPFE